MTTIAWDGKTIAADKRSSYHGNPTMKLTRMADGSICGRAGDTESTTEMIAFLDGKRGAPEKTTDEVTILRAYPDGHAEMCHNKGVLFPVNMPFFAIGSGSDYAMGAMAAGATAEQAIEIASRFDKDTGGGIDTMELTP